VFNVKGTPLQGAGAKLIQTVLGGFFFPLQDFFDLFLLEFPVPGLMISKVLDDIQDVDFGVVFLGQRLDKGKGFFSAAGEVRRPQNLSHFHLKLLVVSGSLLFGEIIKLLMRM
jgi:hypothetical protein